jgi:diguanylate cyclase (GGDEF)-like protein
MARRSKATKQASGATVLVVDDNAEYLEATTLLLENEGHMVLQADNGPSALDLLRARSIDLVLLDYFMPGMTGEEVVAELRKWNPFVQVILQTGYASEQPPRTLLKRLDIQGYFDKSEGPDKLLLWTDVGLKAAYTVQMLHRSRQGLRHILDVTPELHKLQPLQHLLQGILLQVTGLLGANSSFLAVVPGVDGAQSQTSGFVAVLESETDLVIRAGTGAFQAAHTPQECLSAERLELIKRVLKKASVESSTDAMVVPLQVGQSVLGVVYLDRPAQEERDLELVRVFANQAAVAIQNTQLYEMATLDPLTGVGVRRFFEQWLLRELRVAFRLQRPLALLMMDLDDFKRINDEAGHLVGDRALVSVGRVLLDAVRAHDVVGRFGGDEFAVLLPQTDESGGRRVGERVLRNLAAEVIEAAGKAYPLKGSLGLAVLEPHGFTQEAIPRPIPQPHFQIVAKLLMTAADEALYRGKRAGGHRVEVAPPVTWPAFA